MTCARTHGIIDTLTQVRGVLAGLADLDYEGAADTLLRSLRGIGERANALLIVRFKALRRVSLDPNRIGAITRAALVLLHHENNRTL
jgi:hypothetical protein